MKEICLNDLLNNVRTYNELGLLLIEKAYHYARTLHDPVKGSYLLRGLDNNKDQTYFLALLSQKQIDKALFPIGEMQNMKFVI